MEKEEFLMYNCAKCFQRGCTKQDMTKTLPECPSKDAQIQEEAKALYKEPENYKIAYCAALTEAGGYCQDTRLVEIIKFMHRAGYKKIGIAFCTGLFKETQEVVNILEYNGFEVVSIICKNGAITKDFLGLTDEQSVHGSCKNESMCNPIGQALFLNLNGKRLTRQGFDRPVRRPRHPVYEVRQGPDDRAGGQGPRHRPQPTGGGLSGAGLLQQKVLSGRPGGAESSRHRI